MRDMIDLSLLARFLNRLVPHHCPICDSQIMSAGLCGTCWSQLCFIQAPICTSCGRPLISATSPQQHCGKCLTAPNPVTRMRSILRYDDASKGLILPFKHAGRLELTSLMARMMQAQFATLIDDETLIMPIPLHFTRRAYRRYNQSAELARELCTLESRPHQLDMTSLYRRKATRSLARHNKTKRQAILRHAFAIRDRAIPLIKDRPILLIDDVMTTGQTSFHAAKTLLKAGSGPVYCLTIARVL